MKYKALILDLDGTTIPNRIDGIPSERVVAAITKATKRITVCAATGRTLPYLKEIFRRIPFNGLCVLNNGTHTYDPVRRQVVEYVYLPSEHIPTIYSFCSRRYTGVYINYAGKKERLYRGEKINGKVVSMFIPELEKSAADLLQKEIEGLDGVRCHLVSSWKEMKVDMEISSIHASKLHGIQKIAHRLGITTHEIIGVGDSYNDFSLLMACGLKIAMGNAVSELKAIADFVAPPVEEDGVATIIEKFILAA